MKNIRLFLNIVTSKKYDVLLLSFPQKWEFDVELMDSRFYGNDKLNISEVAYSKQNKKKKIHYYDSNL
jgi:hypothetical protein